jgi:hypothetical protein
MYPSHVSDQPTWKISDFFCKNLVLGAENIPQNPDLACRDRMWKNYFDHLILKFHIFENTLFLQIIIDSWIKKIFKKFFHILTLYDKLEFLGILVAQKKKKSV